MTAPSPTLRARLDPSDMPVKWSSRLDPANRPLRPDSKRTNSRAGGRIAKPIFVRRRASVMSPAAGRPDPFTLVFSDSKNGYLRRQNWRRRIWIPALRRAGLAYFRTYHLRHTCATLLLYEGRTVNEVADHLGHADPGFTARTYAHVMRDASKRRRVPLARTITAARRPLVDPSASDQRLSPASRARNPSKSRKPTRGFEPRTPSLRESTEEGSQSPPVPPGLSGSQIGGLATTAGSPKERSGVRLVFGPAGSNRIRVDQPRGLLRTRDPPSLASAAAAEVGQAARREANERGSWCRGIRHQDPVSARLSRRCWRTSRRGPSVAIGCDASKNALNVSPDEVRPS